MSTTKVLVVANAPGILQRVEDTLAGLEVHVAIRLRDVAGVLRQGDCTLVVLYLGFEEQSTVELIASIAGEPSAHPPAVVCLAPLELRQAQCPGPELEAQVRAAGAAEYINLADYPRSAQGNEVLRRRILAVLSNAQRLSPVARVLRRAARIAGGASRLANRLDVSETDLLRWMQGGDEAPERVFLAAFDIVLTDLERGGT